MGRVTTLEERVHMQQCQPAGWTVDQTARETGWAPSTVRKWRRRAQQGGPDALRSCMGRPAQGLLSSFPEWMRAQLRDWRQAHPGWGPKTLRAQLQADARSQDQCLPSRAQIAAFLKQSGLVRPYQRHTRLPAVPASPPQAPHEEWEMDARGAEWIPQLGMVTLIHLKDRCSRAYLLSHPCWLGEQRVQRHPSTEDYQLALRRAFSHWGLPDRLAVDHDSVFYDNGSPSPFPTRLHLWLLALGVPLVFGPAACPTQRAIIERSHQIWAQQVLWGQSFAAWQGFEQVLDQRQEFLNYCLPCASLGDRPPLQAYPQACSPRRRYRPEGEAELLDQNRVWNFLAQTQWFRRVSQGGTVSLGGHAYHVGGRWARQQIEITFDPTDRHFVFHTCQDPPFPRRPVRSITLQSLMGELGPLVGLPSFQLALPLAWETLRVLRLSQTLGVTT